MKDQPEDKFEQRIRERLQSREVSPDESAWERLAADLPSGSTFRYRWLWVVTIGIALIGSWWIADYVKDSRTTSSPSHSDTLNHRLGTATKRAVSSRSDTTPSSNKSFQQHYQRAGDSPSGRHQVPSESETDSLRPSKHSLAIRSTNLEKKTAPIAEKGNPALLNEEYPPRNMTNRSTSVAVADPGRVTKVGLAPAAKVSATHPMFENTLPAVATDPSYLVAVEWTKPKQSEVTEEANPWEGWLTLAPMLLYQQVTPNRLDAINVTSLNRTPFSEDRWGVQASAGMRYYLSPRWAIKAGLYYRYTKNQWTYNYYESATDSFHIERPNENEVLAEPIYREQVGTIDEVYHHVGALVGGQYCLSSRWLSNTLGVELQTHYQQKQPAWYVYASYTAEKALSRRWILVGGAGFLWNWGGASLRSENLTLKPYGFGVQIGIDYRLQRLR